jgi:hypothetical protein
MFPIQSSTLIERVRAEFLEMPGMQLTLAQASRLFGLDAAACQYVIDTLVKASFLRWTPAGMIARCETA